MSAMELLFSSVVCLTTEFAGIACNNGLKTTPFAIRLQTENQMLRTFCFVPRNMLAFRQQNNRDLPKLSKTYGVMLISEFYKN
jgi:hypothetical protein